MRSAVVVGLLIAVILLSLIFGRASVSFAGLNISLSSDSMSGGENEQWGSSQTSGEKGDYDEGCHHRLTLPQRQCATEMKNGE